MLLPDLETYLAGAGLGLTAETNLFHGILPPSPDVVVALFEYGGRPNEQDLGTPNVRLEFPRVQVVVRGVRDDYDSPRLLAQKIVAAFAAVFNQVLTSATYKSIIMINMPPPQRDDNFRIEQRTNFEVTKTFSTS